MDLDWTGRRRIRHDHSTPIPCSPCYTHIIISDVDFYYRIIIFLWQGVAAYTSLSTHTTHHTPYRLFLNEIFWTSLESEVFLPRLPHFVVDIELQTPTTTVCLIGRSLSNVYWASGWFVRRGSGEGTRGCVRMGTGTVAPVVQGSCVG